MRKLPKVKLRVPKDWYPLSVLAMTVTYSVWAPLSLDSQLVHPGTRFLGVLVLGSLMTILGIIGRFINYRTGRYELLSYMLCLAFVGVPLAEISTAPWNGLILTIEAMLLMACAFDEVHRQAP